MCKVIFLVFLFFTNISILQASSSRKLSNQSPNVIAHSPPNTFVNNTVNVIEGNFYFNNPLLSVPGAVELPVIQYYNNQSNYTSWLGIGMTLNHCFWMQGKEDADKSRDEDAKYGLLLAEAEGGSIIRCIGKTKPNTTNYYYLDPAVIHDGLTNCGSGEISARTNLKNCRIEEDVTGIHYADWTCYLPDGSIREFNRAYKKEDSMNVKRETRPNKTYLDYEFHKQRSEEGTPKRITAKAKHELNWLEFENDEDHHKATISSSNGKKASFKYCRKDGKYYVEEIDSSDHPKQEFHYTRAGDNYCIDRIDWPHGRFLEVEYDHKGRVKYQKAPVGKDGEKRTIWSFSYDPDHHQTEVHDVHDNKRIYRYKSKRLTALEHYTKRHKLYRTQAYFWGEREGLSWAKHPKTDEGNLLAEALLDEDEKAHYAHHLSYDDYGNVVKETIYGNLSGAGKKHFALSSDGTPKDSHVEHYSKRYTYSNDRLHLKRTEKEDDGPKVEYRYKKNTDLVWAKFIYDGDTIIKREFYSYDTDSVLLKKIVDNGRSANKKSFHGVTQRLITKIVPVQGKEGYGNGLPEKVIEQYLDLKTGKKVLLCLITFSYNKASLVTEEKVYDANKKHRYTLNTSYDSMGRVVRKTNELGELFTFNYDDNSNKIYEKLEGAGFYTKHFYDRANRLVQTTQYHDDGTEVTCQFEYDLMGNKTASTDRYSNTTYYQYDEYDRLCKVILPEVDNAKYSIKKEYDLFDNIISETNSNGAVTSYKYNSRKQPILITYADSSQEFFEYNLNGTLAQKWDKSGTKTSYKYDVLGRILKTTTYDIAGNKLYTCTNRYNGWHLISTTDSMGYTTYYNYDGAGRKIEEWKETQDNFSKITFEYDALGRLCATKNFYKKNDKDFIATKFEYDLLNRPTAETREDASGGLLSATYYKYDALGNRTKVTSAINATENSITRAIYNSQNELVRLVDEYNKETAISYNHAHKNFHKQKTLCKTITDPLGNITKQHFDTWGRLVSTIGYNSQGTLLCKSDLQYNATNQKIRQIEYVVIDGKVDHEYFITWEYDPLDRVTKQSEQPGTPDEKVTCYTYDFAGRLSQLTKPDGVILSHYYDTLSRLMHLSSSDGSISYRYTYDLHNNILEAKDEVTGTVTKRSYDAWDRPRSEGLEGIYSLSYVYDPLGRLQTLTLPDNSSVQYAYEKGHLHTIKRLSPAQEARYEHTYVAFDLKDHILESRLIGQQTANHNWDKKGRRIGFQAPGFKEEIPPDGYDAVGNLKQYTFTDPIGQVQFQATYDDTYQLTSETGVQPHTYHNDSIHNRRKKDTSDYTLDHTNRLLSDTKDHFVYDKNGNLIEHRSTDNTTYYIYDALDRLTKVKNGDDIITYTYDSFHRRIAQTTTKGCKYFLHQGLREIGLFDPATQKITQFRVLGLGKGAELGASIALELENTIYCPLHDHRGNIVCLLDATTGAAAETYRYTAFGERELYDASSAPILHSQNPWGFASKRHDPETGYIYFSRRYYAPHHGRWVTPDPLCFADGPNLYAYVHNNPLTRFDLYGLFEDDDLDLRADIAAGNFYGEFFGEYAYAKFAELGVMWHQAASLRSFSNNLTMHPIDTTKSIVEWSQNAIDNLQATDSSKLDTYAKGIWQSATDYLDNRSVAGISADVTAFFTNPFKWLGLGAKVNKTNQAVNAEEKLATATNQLQKNSNTSIKVVNSVAPTQKADFIVGSNGTAIPTNRAVFEQGLQKAGFETFPTRSPGMGYVLSHNLSVRIMEPRGPAPLRASFTHKPEGGHINPFTGKPVHPPKGLDAKQKEAFVRERTHIELGE